MSSSIADKDAEIASLQRRLKWAQTAAEKHHEGNRAACEREAKLLQDKARLDWIERNLLHVQRLSAPDMSGIRFVGQLYNEARGDKGGPSYFKVSHRNLRQAIDDAMGWEPNVQAEPRRE